VVDNDKNDCNPAKGIVSLNGVKFAPYVIDELHLPEASILHEASITLYSNLPAATVNIVDNKDLGSQLAYNKIPLQYIVSLKNNITSDPQSIANKFIGEGAQILHVYRYALKGFAVRVPSNLVLNNILSDPRVDKVEQDQIGRIASAQWQHTVPTDPISPQVQSTINSVKEKNNTEVNADIAIIDTGISRAHAELNVYRDVTFVGTSSGEDDNGHGSLVAGIAAAKYNPIGVVGIAPGARLWAVKVCDRLGNCPISDQIAGVDYVTQHANEIDVANLSVENPLSTLLDRAVDKSVAAGVTYVVAAGNQGKDASSTSPAHDPSVITVSAIADSDGKCGGLGRVTIGGADDTLANFSNFGPHVSIAAPGVDIFSTFKGDEYGLDSGTSEAAPHVTGYAALYKESHPGASPSDVRSAILNSASLPTTVCNGSSHGYFSGEKDGFHEPLLYVRNDWRLENLYTTK
jgi:subtilisin family serine protease